MEKSIRAFYNSEKKRKPSYLYFLYVQLCYTKKHWWVLQAAALFTWIFLAGRIPDSAVLQRSLGILAFLFIILIIPELFREEQAGMTELEATLFYSLRDVYSARLLLFGMADAVILLLFCLVLRMNLRTSPLQMVSQFFVPLVISTLICFLVLCSRKIHSPYAAGFLCIAFCGIWWRITMDERIFLAVQTPAWILVLCISILFLVLSVRATLRKANTLS